MSRIVIAIGGNALQRNNEASAEAQIRVARETARQLISLVRDGHEVAVVHGNGPQVGNIILREETLDTEDLPSQPIDTCVAMSQGSIGYWLQLAIGNELKKAGINKSVASLVTQTLVRREDPAFSNPSKPIGPFYKSREEALAESNGRQDYTVKEDAGRGWRRVVPSPKPVDIVEKDFVDYLVGVGFVVIAAGGGGIPVIETQNGLVGIEAVVDKDFAAEKLAESIRADVLLILTAVEQVMIDFNKPSEYPLTRASVDDLRNFIRENQFAPGSMLPKIEASMEFVGSGEGRKTIITTPEKAYEAMKGRAGTTIAYK